MGALSTVTHGMRVQSRSCACALVRSGAVSNLGLHVLQESAHHFVPALSHPATARRLHHTLELEQLLVKMIDARLEGSAFCATKQKAASDPDSADRVEPVLEA